MDDGVIEAVQTIQREVTALMVDLVNLQRRVDLLFEYSPEAFAELNRRPLAQADRPPQVIEDDKT